MSSCGRNRLDVDLIQGIQICKSLYSIKKNIILSQCFISTIWTNPINENRGKLSSENSI